MKIQTTVDKATIPAKRQISAAGRAEIEKMLRSENHTLQEIGDRFGVTRAWIGQIASRAGFHGYQRLQSRQFKSQSAKMDKISFVAEAKKRGLEVCPGLGSSKSSFIVNGKSCAILRASPRPMNRVHIRTCQQDAEIYVWKLPDGRFLILPQSLCPAVASYFSLEEPKTQRKGAYCNRHFHRDYIEAWHLFSGGSE